MADYIWTMWWQGYKQAPTIVKCCIESMRRYNEEAAVIVIDASNYADYISLPTYIEDKFRQGLISVTHLSDIIRMKLISQYGGLWIDATVLLTDKIPGAWFASEFFTVKQTYDGKKMSGNIAKGRWTSFLLGGKSGNIICASMEKLFDLYWKYEDSLIDYYLIDYFMDIVYTHVKGAEEMFRGLESDSCNIFELERILACSEYTHGYEKISVANKLNWKKSYPREIDGKSTVYDMILCKYGFCREEGNERLINDSGGGGGFF